MSQGSSSSGNADGTTSSSSSDSDTNPVVCDVEPPEGMLCIPEGVFEMGDLAYGDEQPVRQVEMSMFFIDQREVTVAEYAACVDGGGCAASEGLTFDEDCNWSLAGREDHPINCVTWDEASSYCAWAGKQLPSEAQWEKAARGTDARMFPWGDELADCTFAVMFDDAGPGCGAEGTMPVGSRSPAGDSVYGGQDMGGNVAEWCADWWSDGYDPAQTVDPVGSASGTDRVLRGGGWTTSTPGALRAASRDYAPPLTDPADDYLRGTNDGFRCAMDS